uniref:Pancreatic trypsin inhibitor n=1 Tax=Rhipicephalus appendiculatus TaxID=34631 RepID=A0A131YPY8_RHIAP
MLCICPTNAQLTILELIILYKLAANMSYVPCLSSYNLCSSRSLSQFFKSTLQKKVIYSKGQRQCRKAETTCASLGHVRSSLPHSCFKACYQLGFTALSFFETTEI